MVLIVRAGYFQMEGITMSELFQVKESLSPRLKWLKEFNATLAELPDGTRVCVGRHAIGYGDTHKDAELRFAEAEEIKHWSVTEFQKAGVVIPTEVEEESC
jgi:hypothetical protein